MVAVDFKKSDISRIKHIGCNWIPRSTVMFSLPRMWTKCLNILSEDKPSLAPNTLQWSKLILVSALWFYWVHTITLPQYHILLAYQRLTRKSTPPFLMKMHYVFCMKSGDLRLPHAWNWSTYYAFIVLYNKASVPMCQIKINRILSPFPWWMWIFTIAFEIGTACHFLLDPTDTDRCSVRNILNLFHKTGTRNVLNFLGSGCTSDSGYEGWTTQPHTLIMLSCMYRGYFTRVPRFLVFIIDNKYT